MKPKAYILILLLSLAVSGQTITDININVGADGFAQITEKVIFDEEGMIGKILVPPYSTQFRVTGEWGPLENELMQGDEGLILRVFFPEYIEPGHKKTVEIVYGTHHLTKKEDGVWKISYERHTTPHKTILRLNFPPGTQIISLQPTELLRTYVNNGVWIYPQKPLINFTIQYQYGVEQTPDETIQTEAPREEAGSEILAYSILALALALIMYSIIKLKTSKTWKKPFISISEPRVTPDSTLGNAQVSYGDEETEVGGDKTVKDSILKMLDETELSIIRLIESNDTEETTQAYIQKTLGIPKSSLSDIIRQLEKRNIIERRSQGRLKWIKLRKWVLE
jgi:uncharacterized membrane protein